MSTVSSSRWPQEEVQQKAHRNRLAVQVRMLWNLVNPKLGGKTVVVSRETGDIVATDEGSAEKKAEGA